MRGARRCRSGGAAVVAALLVVGCGGSGGSGGEVGSSSTSRGDDASRSAPTTAAGCVAEHPEELRIEVVRSIERESESYTQGLVVDDGRLFESGGRYGESTLRELNPDTGDELRRVEVDPELFAEGLGVAPDGSLVQLTWKEGTALVWDPDTFEIVRELRYDGEGWGLTTLADGTLVMSDGSDTLVERDPDDFSVRREMPVSRVGGDADRLNELDFDGESVWANRYQTDELVRIDPECWTVDAVVDLSALRSQARSIDDAADDERFDVANGVAHIPGTDHYLVTGKWWPVIYEVRFVPT